MHHIYLGRQPIYNRKLALEAFELLYRKNDAGGGSAPADDAAGASRAILSALTEVGLPNLVDTRLAFIRIAPRFVLDGGLDSVQHAQLVLGIAADASPDPALLPLLQRLRAQGRRFALDPYADTPASRALLEVTDFVKLDVAALPEAELRQLAPQLSAAGVRLMGGRIENRSALELCQGLGFHYLQGYFFSQPKLLRFRTIATHQAAILRLIGVLNDPQSSIREVEELVSQDVSLSYKLLRHINSAYFNLPNRVDSIRRAVILLGFNQIKSWATLISLANLDAARSDLTNTALVRAYMCEELARATGTGRAETAFTVGLLSVLDSLTQAPIEQIVASLPLAEDVVAALTTHSGPFGRLLACTLAYERGDWDAVDASGLPGPRVGEAYLGALALAHRATARMR